MDPVNDQTINITFKGLAGEPIISLELQESSTIQELFLAVKSQLIKMKKLSRGYKIVILENSTSLSTVSQSSKLFETINLSKDNITLTLVISKTNYKLAIIANKNNNFGGFVQIYNPDTNHLQRSVIKIDKNSEYQLSSCGCVKFDQNSKKVNRLINKFDYNLSLIVKNHQHISIHINDSETKDIIRKLFSDLSDIEYNRLIISLTISLCARYVIVNYYKPFDESSSIYEEEPTNLWLIDRELNNHMPILDLPNISMMKFDDTSTLLSISFSVGNKKEIYRANYIIVYSLTTLEEIYRIELDKSQYNVSLSIIYFNESVLVTYRFDKYVDIWINGKLNRNIKIQDILPYDDFDHIYIREIIISPDLRYLAIIIGSDHQTLFIYDLEDNRLIETDPDIFVDTNIERSSLFFILDE